MSDELKPCPFCGELNVISVEINADDVCIGCTDCGFHGHAFNSEEEARRAWNKRSYKGMELENAHA